MFQDKIEKVQKRDGTIVDFEPSRIQDAIFKAITATGQGDGKKARKLSDRVVKILNRRFKKGEVPYVEQIQDVVEEVLILEGLVETAKAYILYREQRRRIREAVKVSEEATERVDQYLEKLDWEVQENANMAFSLQGLNHYGVSYIVKRYWLNKIYPKEIREAVKSGDFHIHNLDTLGPYTFFGREVVVAKLNGNLNLISLKDLYEEIQEPEVLLNKKDQVFAKYPQDLFVLDRNGWVRASRMVRKKKEREMRFIKSEQGQSIIVTDNHPFIVKEKMDDKEKEIEARDVREKNHLMLSCHIPSLISKENLFLRKHLYLGEELIKKGHQGFFLEGFEWKEFIKNWGGSLKVPGTLSTSNSANSLNNKLELTEDLGYLVGFFIAEGNYDSWRLAITTSEKKIIEKIQRICAGLGVRCYIHRKDGKTKRLSLNCSTLKLVFAKVFKIKPFSQNKNLPLDILTYNLDFVRGVIAGIIDGDGSIGTTKSQIVIRVASRTMLEQLSILLQFFGIIPRTGVNIKDIGKKNIFKGKEITQNYPLYRLSFSKRRNVDFPSLKYQKAIEAGKHWRSEEYDWNRVLNSQITKIADSFIYDITTSSNTFLCNSLLAHNCAGWDLYDLLLKGFGGVSGKVESKPAKHFRTALGQVVNFLYTLQGEVAGAVAFSNFDTLLAPFIRYENLNYQQVKQTLQEFLFNMAIPTRVGFQTPFSNVTLDIKPSPVFAKQPVIIGGKPQDKTYEEFQEEMDIFNRAFYECLIEGDKNQRVFTFPIPTINITKDFNWDNPVLGPMWEATSKYGVNYFANYINSDMKPEDIRSMCCRLRIDLTELYNRGGGGLFGAGALTGCYDDKTEILTEDGWKLFKDLTKEDRVFTLSEENKIELHQPLRLFEYDYEGKMIHFKAKSFDLLVTPNHRMVVNHKGSSKRMFVEAQDFKPYQHYIPKGGTWQGQEVEYFVLPSVLIMGGTGPVSRFSETEIETIRQMKKEGNSIYQIAGNFNCNPVTIYNVCTQEAYGNRERLRLRYETPPLKIKMNDWLKFFGFWIAEGCTDNEKIALDHGYRVVISQTNKKRREEIKKVLDVLPFNYYLEGKNNFVICNKQLWSYLRQFGNKYTKFIPKEIKNLSKRQLKILFDWLVKGDGHVREKTTGQINYWTSSKKLAGDLQEIILKLGWMGTLKAQKEKVSRIKGREIKAGVVYEIGVQKTKHYGFAKKEKIKERIKEVDYRGKVYCCEVPNHAVFVRRNGKVTWCGNSIGVVTINLPRIGYLSKTKKEFFERLTSMMDLAKESLVIKRKVIENFIEKGLYPYSRFYLSGVKKMRGQYYGNHFSTIGLVGMNEALLNFIGENITSKKGRNFTLEILDFMREKLVKYQEETGSVYNLEATPAESTAYRLAQKDKEKYPDIITAGTKEVPYYTNSTHLPVNFTDDVFEALRLQDELQCRYSGGTVLHLFLGERVSNPEMAKSLIKKIFENFRLPYITLTPTFSICPNHGYLEGEYFECPKCTVRQSCEVYTRIVGYLRPIQQWNVGKKEEFKWRREYRIYQDEKIISLPKEKIPSQIKI